MIPLINSLLTEAVLRRAAGLVMVLCAVIAQSAHLFFVSGLNPNLVASALLALAYFEKDISTLWFFATFALILLLPYPFGFWAGAAFLLALTASLLAVRFIRRYGAKSLPAVLMVFTVVFYIVLAPAFVLQSPLSVLS